MPGRRDGELDAKLSYVTKLSRDAALIDELIFEGEAQASHFIHELRTEARPAPAAPVVATSS